MMFLLEILSSIGLGINIGGQIYQQEPDIDIRRTMTILFLPGSILALALILVDLLVVRK